ncbi:MAG: helix-turn-helix transcriptional regulator [Acidobacteria bacterium]|nr:helix-turn-helix transcriptional regulator [Acidobacteriota bacterium]
MPPKTPYLGEFEYAVLLAVVRLGDEAYAVPMRELIEDRTGRPVARGALYTALERLEAKGCLRSRMGDPTPERGGRARRYFSVTPLGLRALKSTHAAFASLTKGLEAVLEQP